ncbi:hypothetical protein FF011L_47810 [Roseimaritima multifibrata]|uniref:Polysaccharide biosynthesis protein n=1 Tax=Roseimaritima multifibrata TaxID=1930274 RepID=A0A517MMH2_9BACT|nr:hypothetical protein [Roseimaritima multifibrata]QDS95977.1 hypothetical protein FF011L_47810 [Roseimaritima multifibrata]
MPSETPPLPPEPIAEPPRRSWPRRMLNRLEVNQAVFFAICVRGWQFAAGPVTLLLIAHYFSEEMQGYYYTFGSVVGLQMFFELSLPQVLINSTSHEWDGLELSGDGYVVGDRRRRSRLGSLFRIAMRWYLIAAVLSFFVVAAAGFWFFGGPRESENIAWQWPWLAVVLGSSFSLLLSPCMAVLEGCHQVQPVYKNQLTRSVLGTMAVWISIPMGAGLWVPAIVSVVRVGCEAAFVGGRYRNFFVSLWRQPVVVDFQWFQEVWPFQWRMTVKGFFGFFNAYLLVPVLFYFHGPIPAGRMGMTWQVLGTLLEASGSWVRARMPLFGSLIARRNFSELDRVFRRVSCVALGILLVALVAVNVLVLLLDAFLPKIGDRLLSPLPVFLLSLAILVVFVVESLWRYVHCHLSAPYIKWALAGDVLNGLLVLALVKPFGAVGVAAGYLAANALFKLPLAIFVWRKIRQRWH